MNLFLEIQPRYLTVQDIKDTSKNISLISLTDDEIIELIVKAEIEADRYIGYSIDDFDEYSDIDKKEIKIAILYIVENIFSLGDSIQILTTGLIQSESTGDRSVTFKKEGAKDTYTFSIPNIAKLYLRKFKREFYNLAI